MDREFRFTVDVAALPENAKCERFYTKRDNGLEQDWAGERVWCNPPYDHQNLIDFVGKGWRTVRDDPTTVAVFLVPVKSDQVWWHDFALQGEIRYIRGRVAFGGAAAAPMPVCFVVFGVDYPPRGVSLQQPQRGLFDGP
jgi:phage N-6-adenine-methyltransferase